MSLVVGCARAPAFPCRGTEGVNAGAAVLSRGVVASLFNQARVGRGDDKTRARRRTAAGDDAAEPAFMLPISVVI